MCLTKVTNRNVKGPVVAWKIMKRKKIQGKTISRYRSLPGNLSKSKYLHDKSDIFLNSYKKTWILENDIEYQTGFHCYKTRREAREEFKNMVIKNRYKIVKVILDDIVCEGLKYKKRVLVGRKIRLAKEGE